MRHLKSLGTRPFCCIWITAVREYHGGLLTQHLSLTAGTHLRRMYCNCFQVWASLSGRAVHTCSFAAMLQVHKVKIEKISSHPSCFKDKPVHQRVRTLCLCALQDPSLHAPSLASPVPPWLQAERCDARVPGPRSFGGRGPSPLWATPLCSGPAPGNRPAGGADVSASAPGCHLRWPGRIRWRPQSTAWQEKQIINMFCVKTIWINSQRHNQLQLMVKVPVG